MTNTNDNWIYQSNKLIEASYSFTVLEQKLIRLLASMINKDDDDFKEYKFKAVDLSKLFKINQKNIYMELDKITDKLMTRYIKIKHNDSQKFKKRHLIKIADFENGILTMKIDEDMKEFYLKLNWYTKYQLKNIMQFKSTYSFRLYELFKQYENIGHRLMGIEDLRHILEIDKNQYAKYSNLKQKVISVGINEININTDLHIDYEEMKEVRKVTTIKFYIRPTTKAKNEMITAKVVQAPNKSEPYIDNVKLIIKNVIDDEISDKTANDIYQCATKNRVYGNMPLELINEVAEYSKTQDIKNGFVGWAKSIISTYERPIKTHKTSNFNDYPQRSYDYDELEKKLLGIE